MNDIYSIPCPEDGTEDGRTKLIDKGTVERSRARFYQPSRSPCRSSNDPYIHGAPFSMSPSFLRVLPWLKRHQGLI